MEFAAHAEHVEAPPNDEYVPRSQSVHADAPAREYLPSWQAPQLFSLVCSGKPKNLPAAQSVQTAAPSSEYFPAMQLSQSVALVCASEPENLPAAQSLQTQAPAANYVPAPQSVPSIRLCRCKASLCRGLTIIT